MEGEEETISSPFTMIGPLFTLYWRYIDRTLRESALREGAWKNWMYVAIAMRERNMAKTSVASKRIGRFIASPPVF